MPMSDESDSDSENERKECIFWIDDGDAVNQTHIQAQECRKTGDLRG